MSNRRQEKTVDGVTYVITHAGQKREYGDSYYEYDVTSDLPAEQVERVCVERIRAAIPEKQYTDEYRAKPSADLHFRAHYKFRKVSDGKYFYSVCFPYTD